MRPGTDFTVRYHAISSFGDEKAIEYPESMKPLSFKIVSEENSRTISVYKDAAQKQRILRIKSEDILDTPLKYDVFGTTDNFLGRFEKKGDALSSDVWEIIDTKDRKAFVYDGASWKTALRNIIPKGESWVPQNYDMTMGDKHIANFQQYFNPFLIEIGIFIRSPKLSKGMKGLALAAGILIATRADKTVL